MASHTKPPAHPASPGTHYLVVEDHPMFREAINGTLLRMSARSQIVSVASLADARLAVGDPRPWRLAVLDLDLPDSSGLATLRTMLDLLGDCPIVVFSGRDEGAFILRCLEAGARGYLPKTMNSDAVKHAFQLVEAGNLYVPPQAVGSGDGARWTRATSPAADLVASRALGFTDRQMEVFKRILRGLPNKLICRELNLAEGTIKVHVSAVLRILGVHNRTQAIIAARELGLMPTEEDIARSNRVNPTRRAIPATYAGPPPA